MSMSNALGPLLQPALRNNAGKPQLGELLKFDNALANLAKVLEMGAVKYERDNWLRGGKPDSEYLDAAVRHMVAYVRGDVYDPDTGCHHLAHAAWNLLALQRLNQRELPPLDPDFDLDGFMERYA